VRPAPPQFVRTLIPTCTVLIQNTTFGGTRGFARKPSTPWKDDAGNAVGIVHTERRLTYALFNNVGALVPRAAPGAAYAFFRDFVLAASSTGTLTVDAAGNAAVLGGEDATAADDAPRVADAVYAGAAHTASTLAAPSATLVAWAQFVHPPDSAAQSAAAGRAVVPRALAVVAVAALYAFLR
jgi:carboxypeptidase D